MLAMQIRRESAASGRIEGPPYHVDIAAVRALFPADQWSWPEPPYPAVKHPAVEAFELAFVLERQ